MIDYVRNISKFNIVDKGGQAVPFFPNDYQKTYLSAMTTRDYILKVRQCGFSSVIDAIFTIDFLLVPNSRSVVLSHDTESAQKLLDRVKFYLSSAEKKGLSINLKYNSRNELFNADKNSSFYIGKAGSKSFGRGDTLTSLHISEWAFCEDPKRLLASVLQAVTPTGRAIIETTANGMNEAKIYWNRSKAGETGFKTHFFGNEFYSPEFLAQKERELGPELFKQEYPINDSEAFLSSGNPFFDKEARGIYLSAVREPEQTFNGFYDLLL